MTIAIVPARGGSKRVPRKNLRAFAGKPMITWPLEVALATPCFRAVIVSTDDEAIAEIALGAGAQVPFLRPPELADDHTGTVDVIAHAIESVADLIENDEPVCCLYPTAAFVSSADLEAGLASLNQSDYEYVCSAVPFEHPVQRGFSLGHESAIKMLSPEHSQTRSQDLEPIFHDAGQWYWGRSSIWCNKRPLLGARTGAFVIPRRRAHDIDTEEDWAIAEAMFMAARGPGQES